MPFWLPNGTTLLRLIETEVRDQLRKRDYKEIATPQVLDEGLWHRSGHWDNYKDEMYFMQDDDQSRIQDNYLGNYARLVDVKRTYDPDNLFHNNQNIKP